jgi:hypothetical protein
MSPHNTLTEWAELAEEQGWKVVSKPDGRYAFYPPANSVPPDLRVINLVEPLSGNNKTLQNNRALLKRAGLKFEEDKVSKGNGFILSETLQVPVHNKSEPTLDDLIAGAHLDINTMMDSLSKLSEKLGLIQKVSNHSSEGYEKIKALAEALKNILTLRLRKLIMKTLILTCLLTLLSCPMIADATNTCYAARLYVSLPEEAAGHNLFLNLYDFTGDGTKRHVVTVLTQGSVTVAYALRYSAIWEVDVTLPDGETVTNQIVIPAETQCWSATNAPIYTLTLSD